MGLAVAKTLPSAGFFGTRLRRFNYPSRPLVPKCQIRLPVALSAAQKLKIFAPTYFTLRPNTQNFFATSTLPYPANLSRFGRDPVISTMSEGRIQKPDKDFTKDVDKTIPEATELTKV